MARSALQRGRVASQLTGDSECEAGKQWPAQDAQSLIRLNDDAGLRRGKLSPLPPLAASSGSTRARARMASGLAVVSPVQPVWGRAVSRGFAASWLFSSRRQALTLLAHHRPCLRCLTFELSRPRRWDARPGLAKMYRVPPDRAWWPAVGARLERGVRHQRAAAGPDCICVPEILLPAQRHGKSSRGTPRLRRLPRVKRGASRLAGLTNAPVPPLIPSC
jgi:hypothetical protein